MFTNVNVSACMVLLVTIYARMYVSTAMHVFQLDRQSRFVRRAGVPARTAPAPAPTSWCAHTDGSAVQLPPVQLLQFPNQVYIAVYMCLLYQL